jgi:blue copper oxidase
MRPPPGSTTSGSDDREFAVVGSDGGLLPEPVTARRLVLSPGERAEIVVRIRPGETVVLRSFEPDLGVNAFTRPFEGGKDRFDVLQLRAADDLTPSAALPDALGLAPDLDVTDDVEVDRTFTLQGNKINGQAMDMARVDAVVEVNTTEVWEVESTDGDYHNFHVHDVQFQILTINGDPPPADYGGWKDTVFLRPSTTVRLVLRVLS